MANRNVRSSRRSRILAVISVLSVAFTLTVHAQATSTWSRNLFVSSATVFQDPYPTACTAASAMIMLNTIAYRHTGGAGFLWRPYKVKNSTDPRDVRDLTSILAFERGHDTLSVSGDGSDPHGWRNALNYYGWGSAVMTDPSKRVYETLAFGSYDSAVHAAVRAIARFGMPVGIATWAGGHAQVMTGYVVDGADPALSSAFTVRYVYVTDPLYLQQHIDYKVSDATLRSGTFVLRFQSYRQSDSPYDDPYTVGWKRSSVRPATGPSQWYGRWVIVAPIRTRVAAPSPTPSPTPSPSPSESPSPVPLPTADASPPPSDIPPTSNSPSSSPDASPEPSAYETASSPI